MFFIQDTLANKISIIWSQTVHLVSDGREMKITSYRDSPRVQVMKLYLLAHKLSTFSGMHVEYIQYMWIKRKMQFCNIAIFLYIHTSPQEIVLRGPLWQLLWCLHVWVDLLNIYQTLKCGPLNPLPLGVKHKKTWKVHSARPCFLSSLVCILVCVNA